MSTSIDSDRHRHESIVMAYISPHWACVLSKNPHPDENAAACVICCVERMSMVMSHSLLATCMRYPNMTKKKAMPHDLERTLHYHVHQCSMCGSGKSMSSL